MIAEVVPINARWKQSFPGMENNLSIAKSKLGIYPDLQGCIPSFPFLMTNYPHLLTGTSCYFTKIKPGFF
jgi:hypothetical protein